MRNRVVGDNRWRQLALLGGLVPGVAAGAAFSFGVVALAPRAALAQTSTATLRGAVRDQSGAPVGGAQIEVRNPASGVRRGAVTNESGFYNIGGIQPGAYTVRIVRIGLTPIQEQVRLPVGEVVTRDFQFGRAVAQQLAAVEVTAATRAVDRSTSEVATNVSTEQIENLPQNNRNFLDFAALAPGVQRRGAGLSTSGVSPNQANLFIDGASFKSDLLPGGIAGQDPGLGSRDLRGVGRISGNPFPQNAVQEFRVVTQNYKAEYQKASGAVVTAATKSGTNSFSGDAFFYGQNRNLLATSYYDQIDQVDKPDYTRSQFGGSLGGPIIRDRAHFFASFEGNYIDLNSRVVYRPPSALAAQLPDSLLTGQGQFSTPFRSNLFFGKADYALSDRQSLIFTANVRRDEDRRGIGGSSPLESEQNVQNKVTSYILRHTLSAAAITNEAQFSFQRQQVLDAGVGTDARRDYGQFGVIRGSYPSIRDFLQDRYTARNDLQFAAGSHVLKGGFNADFLNYDVDKRNSEIPTFQFNPVGVGDVPRRGFGINTPYAATLEIGDGTINENNTQLGFYVQDDWTIASRLTLNLGVRWDYETNGLSNSFETPQIVRDSISAFLVQNPFFDGERYFSSGSDDRKPFLGAVQPRLGFSYDVDGTGRTTIFGGGGVFYDRFFADILLDERLRTQRPRYNFFFRPAGTTGTSEQIPFDPSYYQREALVQLVASGTAGRPEAFLIPDDLRPPRSHQASLGVRRQVGNGYQLSFTGTAVDGYNGLRYVWGNREIRRGATYGDFKSIPGFGAILRATDEGRTWYRALLFQVSRPLTEATRFGGDLSYTLSSSQTNTVNGDDAFALDYVSEAEFRRIQSPFDERSRVVLNLVTRAPFGIRASTLTTLGSGLPYLTSTNCDDTQARLATELARNPNDARRQFCQRNGFFGNGNGQDFDDNPGNSGGVWTSKARTEWFGPFGKWGYRNVDLRLQKDVNVVRGQQASIFFDVYNIFNFDNFNYEQFRYGLFNEQNQQTGVRRDPLPFATLDSRRAQVGVRYGF